MTALDLWLSQVRQITQSLRLVYERV